MEADSLTLDRVRLPWPVRAINAAGARLPAAFPPTTFNESTLLRDARRIARRHDGDAGPFATAFRTLIRSIENDAALNFVGRLLIRRHIVRSLSNAMSLDAELEHDPDLASERIQRPLFIVGFPRTGTTLLHRLLACLDGARVPRLWELMWPTPPPRADRPVDDPRVRRTERIVRGLAYMSPHMATVHALDAHGPEECYYLLENTFMSWSYPIFMNLPGYASWLARQDMMPVYARYRLQLQMLQRHSPGSPWVLKFPDHARNLDAVLATFPDAAIVHTHRHLTAAAASMCSLTATTRLMTSDRVDRAALGSEWMRDSRAILDRALSARDRIGPGPFFDLRYEELVSEPIACVRRICDRFGLGLTPAAEDRMRALLHPGAGQRGSHRYTLQEFGLDRETIARVFGDYHQRFGI